MAYRARSELTAEELEDARAQARSYRSEWRKRIRLEALTYYSGGTPKCSCCGDTHLIFLTMNHVGGDGAEHRRTEFGSSGEPGGRNGGYGGSHMLWTWLKRNGYPDGFEVLCFNCNFAQYWGGCPHKEEI